MNLVNTTTEDHVLKMSLNRPEKMNAFNIQMLKELAEAFTRLEDSPDLRCGFLCYEGSHFTSGLDLAEVGPSVQNGHSLFDEGLVDPVQVEGRKRTKPVVMAVGGYCLTIGIELILASDICIAHSETKFGQIEIKRGIFPFGGATVRMPQRCGWGNAMRYLLTGDMFSAEEAYRIGLIQQLADDPIEAGFQIAKTIAAQAPLGVYATLASAREAFEKGTTSALGSVQETARKLMETEDAREGLLSFVERRAADFKGK